jgi:deoxyribodipyrimidine photo-lyase
MTVFWFRRDLRLHDNHGLFQALKYSDQVLPIFIFDPHILEQLPTDDARVTFMHEQLSQLQQQLQTIGKSLAVFHGNPIQVLEQLIAKNKIDAVFCNHDYEPSAIKRDDAVANILKDKSISFHTFKDQVIFERNEVVKDDGLPYVVYTPFSKKWKDKLSITSIETYDSTNLLQNIAPHSYPFLTLENIGFTASNIKMPPYNISEKLIDNYEATRNFPAVAGTSLLGTYLRFGVVSTRQMVTLARKSENLTFLNELIWREFFMQILWHFPHTVTQSFKPAYDAIVWNNNEDDFKKWCNGQTGYPIVDAGMRELNATGLMHNRVRMIVASFLCKHLLIDWRWGEAYFAIKLLDYEQSSNVGNWQWVAGTGVDAAPYFRIFNPTEQVKKFDNQMEYIKKWVPEFQELTYAKPMVNHEEARKRCLERYKEGIYK